MRKFLIVGCGGSGGATQRLIIDQLQADLRARGWLSDDAKSGLPSAWQFVHVDVPVEPDRGPGPLGTIRDLGGNYVSLTHASNTYQSNFDRLSTQVNGLRSMGHGALAGWATRNISGANSVPVTDGAGQYRMVGRTLTMPHLDKIQATLREAYSKLTGPMAWGNVPNEYRDSDDATVVPIVVASMAGGSGASMFLDVCRIVGSLPGVPQDQIGVFLYTADVFHSLPEAARQNVQGNAMACTAESIASMISPLTWHYDSCSMDNVAGGVQGGRPFGRLFPIGRHVGATGQLFGDGSQTGVYRGVARMLANMMMSTHATHEYIAYRVGNAQATAPRELFGWDAQSNYLGFGTQGYASLSLGRDRYEHFAAQRLSRRVADHLVKGHYNPASSVPELDQLNDKVANQLPNVLDQLKLPNYTPVTVEGIKAWFKEQTPDQALDQALDGALSAAVSATQQAGSQQAGAWLASVQHATYQLEAQVGNHVEREAYAWAEQWASTLHDAVVAHTQTNVGVFGLPYAKAVVGSIADLMTTWANMLEGLGANAHTAAVLTISESVSGAFSKLKKNQVTAEHPLVAQQLLPSWQLGARKKFRRVVAGHLAVLLRSFVGDVVPALQRALNNSLELLVVEQQQKPNTTGLAQLHSDRYADWPHDDATTVPDRFCQAYNEVLLDDPEGFPAVFTAHVGQLAHGVYEQGMNTLIKEVIAGTWEETGVNPSFTTWSQSSVWRSSAFATDSSTGAATPHSVPAYAFRYDAKDVSERAYRRVQAAGSPFHDFARETIMNYVAGATLPPATQHARAQEFVDKLFQAMAMAAPIVGLDAAKAQDLLATNGLNFEYHYSFTDLPFQAGHPVGETALAKATSGSQYSVQTVDGLKKALSGKDLDATHIGIFGSNYSINPLAFKSVLGPIADQWRSATPAQQKSLWRWKRTRPLYAGLAMAPSEAVACTAGWYVGMLTGLVKTHQLGKALDHTNHTQVFDTKTQAWTSFGDALLSCEETTANVKRDLLAQVLMSHAWALVRSYQEHNASVVSGPEDQRAATAPYLALRRLIDHGDVNSAAPSGVPLGQQQAAVLLRDLIQGKYDDVLRSFGFPAEHVLAQFTAAVSPEDRKSRLQEHFEAMRTAAEASLQFAPCRAAVSVLGREYRELPVLHSPNRETWNAHKLSDETKPLVWLAMNHLLDVLENLHESGDSGGIFDMDSPSGEFDL